MLRRFMATPFSLYRLFSTHKPVNPLVQIQADSTRHMREKYPHLMFRLFKGEIVYTLRGEPPAEFIEAGGLGPRDQSIWLSNTGSGDNMGSVCFSFLPEITPIFSKSPTAYIYAFPLWGIYPVPGGKQRQIISPGAFPRPPVWTARQLLGLDSHPGSGMNRLRLGPLMGEGQLVDHFSCPRFKDYMSEEPRLILPKELPTSDDFPQEYRIIDTPLSAKFQKEVEEHYENQAGSADTPKPR